jgi:3-phenylpropionate/trans-cinnamate dioxygenase ferredoxin subunit
MVTDSWQVACSVDDLPPGSLRACTIADREVVICHSKDGWYALDNVCTHAYARLSEGRLRGIRLVCPLHGASFDVRDGRVIGAPASKSLLTHRLRIVDGQVELVLNPEAGQATLPR